MAHVTQVLFVDGEVYAEAAASYEAVCSCGWRARYAIGSKRPGGGRCSTSREAERAARAAAVFHRLTRNLAGE
jgi:hypothetical protein